jgi:hypothetical protein
MYLLWCLADKLSVLAEVDIWLACRQWPDTTARIPLRGLNGAETRMNIGLHHP